jgi:hypothetical protein
MDAVPPPWSRFLDDAPMPSDPVDSGPGVFVKFVVVFLLVAGVALPLAAIFWRSSTKDRARPHPTSSAGSPCRACPAPATQ